MPINSNNTSDEQENPAAEITNNGERRSTNKNSAKVYLSTQFVCFFVLKPHRLVTSIHLQIFCWWAYFLLGFAILFSVLLVAYISFECDLLWFSYKFSKIEANSIRAICTAFTRKKLFFEAQLQKNTQFHFCSCSTNQRMHFNKACTYRILKKILIGRFFLLISFHLLLRSL